MILLAIVSVLAWIAGFIVLGRFPICPPLAQSSSETPAASLPPCEVAIIIPARNEELNLPRLLASIAAQSHKPAEIIVVDDHSTDQTAAIATNAGVRVITPPPLPDDWRGKPWACMHGAAASHAMWMLFLDADTWLEADGLARILAARPTPNIGALSVSPFHAVTRPYEQLSAYFNLLMTAGVGASTLFPGPVEGLFGQCLLVDRSSYLQIAGHACVRDKILENLHLAKAFQERDVPLRCFVGRQTLSFRMYPAGLSSLVEGWTKAFASGAASTPLPILLMTIFWIVGAVTATNLLLRSPTFPAVLLYLAYALQIAWMLRQIGTFRLLIAALYPLPLAFFFAIFTRSLLRRKRTVIWKGRAVHAD